MAVPVITTATRPAEIGDSMAAIAAISPARESSSSARCASSSGSGPPRRSRGRTVRCTRADLPCRARGRALPQRKTSALSSGVPMASTSRSPGVSEGGGNVARVPTLPVICAS